jgi:Chaperone of endosialidase
MKTTQLMLFAVITVASAAFAVDPPPDGGYPNFNTAEGQDALFSLDTSLGYANTAVGFAALHDNTIGVANTATGANALFNNSTGSGNVANGESALYSNTTGGNNTAVGSAALSSNTTGVWNTATGYLALLNNTTGSLNTANGEFALHLNTTGGSNTANGGAALYLNTTGSGNTANGLSALGSNTTGYNNTACGSSALTRNTTGNNNIAIGTSAGTFLTTGSNNIDIGAFGATGESNTMRLGRFGLQKTTFIAGVSGATVPGGLTVIVDSLGHFGTITSSARFKEAIKPMDKASEAILALKPVIFRYQHELDPKGIPQFGLVAEQVEMINPDLVARDEEGKAYTVRYEAVNAMLLNEFLKEHRKVEEQAQINQQQEARISGQQKEIAALTASLKAQAAQIQQVSDRLNTQSLAPRVVAKD